jgi:hypothetical protein
MVAIPSASRFPVGCRFKIRNDDLYPSYRTTAFQATISGSNLIVSGGTDPAGAGFTLSYPAVAPGTTRHVVSSRWMRQDRNL